MELTYRNSFFRDLDSIGSREPSREIETLIHKIYKARSVSSVPRMKQLKRTKEFEYKIELHVQTKVYWILCDVIGVKSSLCESNQRCGVKTICNTQLGEGCPVIRSFDRTGPTETPSSFLMFKSNFLPLSKEIQCHLISPTY